MKKIPLLISVILMILILSLQPVFAGGDQVRGDKGIGSVVQNGPCPFGSDTPPEQP